MPWVTVFVSAASEFTELPVTPVVVLPLTVAVLVVNGHQVVYTVTASLTTVVAVETMAGEVVSEQTPDSQEVTVTKVVCFVGSVVDIGHHVVYSVATPLTVVVAVETMAGEVVSEQTPDSQEVTVINVVGFVGSVVDIGHHVVYSVVTPLTVVVAVETIADDTDSVHTPDSQEVTVIKVVCSFVTVAVDPEGLGEPESVEVVVEETIDVRSFEPVIMSDVAAELVTLEDAAEEELALVGVLTMMVVSSVGSPLVPVIVDVSVDVVVEAPVHGSVVVVIMPAEDELALAGVLTMTMVSSVGSPLVPVIVDISVDVVVEALVHGSVVVVMIPDAAEDELTLAGVLTMMMVSSVGNPLVPVIVDISVDVVVKAPVHGSVVVVMIPDLAAELVTAEDVEEVELVTSDDVVVELVTSEDVVAELVASDDVAIEELTLVGVLTSMMVSSVGKPLGPVTVEV